MYKCCRNTNFFIMISIVLVETASLVMFILVLSATFGLGDESEEGNREYLISLMNCLINGCLCLIGIWFTLVYGIHALYFKIIYRIKRYIIV